MSAPDDPQKAGGLGSATFASDPAPPRQKDFFRIPARFGNVPVAEQPLGYDPGRRFEHHFPRIELPFQLTETLETSSARRYPLDELFPRGLNRLFFGDCLHIMRMLPSEIVDLIYIDPPFFSGRSYNIVFGDRNEVRSFNDIWEGGMPGYLIWLNARLYEMKRLLTRTGSIVVHCDWHASHYIKIELDRLFGFDSFRNEIVWSYHSGGASSRYFGRKHDILLWYARNPSLYVFNDASVRVPYSESTLKAYNQVDEHGRRFKRITHRDGRVEFVYAQNLDRGRMLTDVWDDIPHLANRSGEKVGYPTQKPEALLSRIIGALTNAGATVADFVCGGGTTLVAAQKLGRRWIGSDTSRVAVAVTADRLTRLLAPTLREPKRIQLVKSGPQEMLDLDLDTANINATSRAKAVAESPIQSVGFAVEHWGVYEIARLTTLSVEEFHRFVLACFGAQIWRGPTSNIHGIRGNETLWIGNPSDTDLITAKHVKAFAEAVLSYRKPQERDGIMIGWNIDPRARAYADRVMVLGQQKPSQALRLRLWALGGDEFKSYVTKRNERYTEIFSFVLPPDVPRIGATRMSRMKYQFDIQEAHSMNPGGRITNVQWDFNHRMGLFVATPGYELCRREIKVSDVSRIEGELFVEHTFEDIEPGADITVACRVQDDLGAEKMQTLSLCVE